MDTALNKDIRTFFALTFQLASGSTRVSRVLEGVTPEIREGRDLPDEAFPPAEVAAPSDGGTPSEDVNNTGLKPCATDIAPLRDETHRCSRTCKFIFGDTFSSIKQKLVIALGPADYLSGIGGTELYQNRERDALNANGVSYLQISPVLSDETKSKSPHKICLNVDRARIGVFSLEETLEILQQILTADRCLLAFHLHHLLKWDFPIITDIVGAVTPKRLSIFVHDYYTLCLGINLMRNNLEYCNAPQEESHACMLCRHGTTRGPHLSSVNALFDWFETKHSSVNYIFPSQVALDNWGKVHPQRVRLARVIPHKTQRSSLLETPNGGDAHATPPPILAERPASTNAAKLKVAYVGYSEYLKGYAFWKDSCKDEQVQKKCSLFHLGYCAEKLPGVTNHFVSFLEGGPDAMISALKHEQIDIAVLCSLCPETFSFTCFESLEAGCFLITTKFSGNIAAQIKKDPRYGIILDSADMLSQTLASESLQIAVAKRKLLATPTFEWNTTLAQEISTLK
jgi:hypothetical protein